jgi:hypothetical protein
MQSFLQFLKEESESESGDGKLKHIPHAEERPLLDGHKGFAHAYNALMQAHTHMKSGGKSSALTMKYDGSPSVVFGHHPTTGRFFAASKSAFNKNPKINYTHEDIDKNHGHAPGLAEKLHSALNHLPKTAPESGVYQGDLMFSEGDKKESKKGVSFTPNTITYTAKGDEANKVRNAKLGIVVHQQYQEHPDHPGLEHMYADSHPDTHNFKQHPHVWMKSAEHDTKQIHYSEDDQKKFNEHMAEAKKIHDEHGKKMYAATSMHQGHGGHLATYINSTVRSGEEPSSEGLKKHISNQYSKAIKKLKTPAAQSRKQAEMDAHVKHIDDNKEHYDNLLKMHHHLQQAKNVLVHNLEQHEGGLEHHIGTKRSKPEGFVVNHNGEPTKLVNREEFAKANFARGELLKASKNK